MVMVAIDRQSMQHTALYDLFYFRKTEDCRCLLHVSVRTAASEIVELRENGIHLCLSTRQQYCRQSHHLTAMNWNHPGVRSICHWKETLELLQSLRHHVFSVWLFEQSVTFLAVPTFGLLVAETWHGFFVLLWRWEKAREVFSLIFQIIMKRS